MGESRNQGPVYAEFSSYTRTKPPPQQNDSCSIFRTSLWKTVTQVITSGLARNPTPSCSFDASPRSKAISARGLFTHWYPRGTPSPLIFWNHGVRAASVARAPSLLRSSEGHDFSRAAKQQKKRFKVQIGESGCLTWSTSNRSAQRLLE
jgi:hypothetical protein